VSDQVEFDRAEFDRAEFDRAEFDRVVRREVDDPAAAAVRTMIAQGRIPATDGDRFLADAQRVRVALLAAYADLDDQARRDLRQSLLVDYQREITTLLAALDPGDLPRIPRAAAASGDLDPHKLPGLHTWLRSFIDSGGYRDTS
jgi:hypothetical protein